MSEVPTPRPQEDADAYAQAALMVVESVIHGLAARGVLTIADAIDILEIAHGAQVEVAEEAGTVPPRQAAELIRRMIFSLQADLAR